MINTKPTSKKPYLIIGVVVVILAFVHFYSKGSGSENASLLEQSSQNTDVSVQVTALFNQIKFLRIDTSLFKDPAYKTLRDYSVAIPQQNVGRTNPFAPVSGFSSRIQTATSTR